MRGIGGFLERYKNFTPPSLTILRAVAASLKEVLGIDVSEKEIRVVHGVAHVAKQGIIRSEIALHKEAILSSIKEKTGDGLKDIR